ncbi:hypothetical protein FACS189499_05880 [Clostridia bacterium]|nr:hypothetical protein FACS189499_05880 [Clostridia bacterium]
MKISFSTLACPNYTFPEIYSMAADLGFGGIEIRGLGDEICAARAKPFAKEQLPKTIYALTRLGLEIPCLSSGACLKFPEKAEENKAEILEYIALAEKLSPLRTKYIRVLGDLNPAKDGEVDDECVARQLAELAPFAEKAGVTLLIETNGVYSDTKRLAKLLRTVGNYAENHAGNSGENVAALWDVHHPYVYSGETPEETIANLGSLIKYVHIKDSVPNSDGAVSYRLTGRGVLPLRDMISRLLDTGYDGYISLEWVKRWEKDLEDAGVVFPHFAHYMSPWLNKTATDHAPEEKAFTEKAHKAENEVSASDKSLYPDRRGTGFYPYPKETLIDDTFPDVLDRVCELFPEQYAFRYTECDYTRTYPEFRRDVDEFAAGLVALGVEKGANVAVWATNVPEWFITFWAAVKIGAVLVTVNTAYKIHEAEYLLRQSDTHTLVMIDSCKDSDYIGIINEICPELKGSEPGKLMSKRLPLLRNVITVDSKQPGCYTFREAAEKGASDNKYSAEVTRRRKLIDRHDVCNMQYTSGTTGFPKGVMLTHYNVVNNGKVIGDCMDLSNYDQMMIQVPMFHCFGMVLAMTASVTHGAAMSPIPMFSPKKGLSCIRKEKITAFHGVPTMFIAMLGHDDFPETDFGNVRTGIMAGSPCPVKVMQDVIGKMKMSEVVITYGQTESSPAITMSRTTDSVEERVATVGKVIYGVEAKIADPETGRTLGTDEDGEICARGYNIMKGYYKMPEATGAVIDADGWLHTGDIGRIDGNGNYRVTGRIKDMIIRGGENIYPKEIEDFLYTHPKISDVQVIGVPDKHYGEEIAAVIIPHPGETLSADEVKDYVRKNMAKHKVPGYVEFTESFPMNAAGKILKYKMREEFAKQHGLS